MLLEIVCWTRDFNLKYNGTLKKDVWHKNYAMFGLNLANTIPLFFENNLKLSFITANIRCTKKTEHKLQNRAWQKEEHSNNLDHNLDNF